MTQALIDSIGKPTSHARPVSSRFRIHVPPQVPLFSETGKADHIGRKKIVEPTTTPPSSNKRQKTQQVTAENIVVRGPFTKKRAWQQYQAAQKILHKKELPKPSQAIKPEEGKTKSFVSSGGGKINFKISDNPGKAWPEDVSVYTHFNEINNVVNNRGTLLVDLQKRNFEIKRKSAESDKTAAQILFQLHS